MCIDDLFGVKDQVIVITGASRGIGKDLAAALGKMGAKISAWSRGEKSLEASVNELSAMGITIAGFPTDVTKSNQVEQSVNKTMAFFGRIDGLINCAGLCELGPTAEFDEELWDQVIGVNLKGTFLCCKYVGAQMLKQRKGKIVNISSVRGLQGRTQDPAYAPSKGGVNLLTKSLAIEWAKDNINVNAIAPTFIQTDLNLDLLKNKEVYNWVLSRIPKGRLSVTDDLVGPVIFLLSPASEFVTGHVLYVDGGWTSA